MRALYASKKGSGSGEDGVLTEDDFFNIMSEYMNAGGDLDLTRMAEFFGKITQNLGGWQKKGDDNKRIMDAIFRCKKAYADVKKTGVPPPDSVFDELRGALFRTEGGVSISKKAFVKEHKNLLGVLKRGKKSELKAEAKDQSKELAKVVKGGADVETINPLYQDISTINPLIQVARKAKHRIEKEHERRLYDHLYSSNPYQKKTIMEEGIAPSLPWSDAHRILKERFADAKVSEIPKTKKVFAQKGRGKGLKGGAVEEDPRVLRRNRLVEIMNALREGMNDGLFRNLHREVMEIAQDINYQPMNADADDVWGALHQDLGPNFWRSLKTVVEDMIDFLQILMGGARKTPDEIREENKRIHEAWLHRNDGRPVLSPEQLKEINDANNKRNSEVAKAKPTGYRFKPKINRETGKQETVEEQELRVRTGSDQGIFAPKFKEDGTAETMEERRQRLADKKEENRKLLELAEYRRTHPYFYRGEYHAEPESFGSAFGHVFTDQITDPNSLIRGSLLPIASTVFGSIPVIGTAVKGLEYANKGAKYFGYGNLEGGSRFVLRDEGRGEGRVLYELEDDEPHKVGDVPVSPTDPRIAEFPVHRDRRPRARDERDYRPSTFVPHEHLFPKSEIDGERLPAVAFEEEYDVFTERPYRSGLPPSMLPPPPPLDSASPPITKTLKQALERQKRKAVAKKKKLVDSGLFTRAQIEANRREIRPETIKSEIPEADARSDLATLRGADEQRLRRARDERPEREALDDMLDVLARAEEKEREEALKYNADLMTQGKRKELADFLTQLGVKKLKKDEDEDKEKKGKGRPKKLKGGILPVEYLRMTDTLLNLPINQRLFQLRRSLFDNRMTGDQAVRRPRVASLLDEAENGRPVDRQFLNEIASILFPLAGGGPIPDRNTLQQLATASYQPTPAKRIGQLQLVRSTPTLKFYQDGNTVVVAIRGTEPSDANDVKADAMIALGQLENSNRYKRDFDVLQQFQTQYPPSKFDYYGVGHSLGGAILDMFLKRGLLKNGVSYNPAVQPQDFQNTTLPNQRVYSESDPLYALMGRKLAKKPETRAPRKKSLLEKLASAIPYVGTAAKGYDLYKSHMLDQFQGGAKAHKKFEEQLKKVGIEPSLYLKEAQRRAKDAGLPYKLLGFSDDDEHKLAIPDATGRMIKFGRVGYGDHLIWTHLESQKRAPMGTADAKRNTFQKSHSAIKGDWKKNPFSPNSLALKVLWSA
jgi:hypothetical protein